jgi:hypothetical protein
MGAFSVSRKEIWNGLPGLSRFFTHVANITNVTNFSKIREESPLRAVMFRRGQVKPNNREINPGQTGTTLDCSIPLMFVKENLWPVQKTASLNKKNSNFLSRKCWSLLPGLRTLDPLLGPPSTGTAICRHTCLQSDLQTSPPTPQKSYLKFWNPRTTFQNIPLFLPNIG